MSKCVRPVNMSIGYVFDCVSKKKYVQGIMSGGSGYVQVCLLLVYVQGVCL